MSESLQKQKHPLLDACLGTSELETRERSVK